MYMLIAIIILIMVLIGFIIYTVSQPVDKEFNKSLQAMGELIGTFDDFDKIEKIQSDKLDIIINL